MSNPRRSATPFALIPLAVLGVLLFLTPLIGLLARTPWSRLGTLLTGPVVREALTLSLISSVLAAVIAVAIGVPLAWILAQGRVPGKGARAGPGDAADGASPGGRGDGPAVCLRPKRPRR